MDELYALDIETTGLDRFTDRILCIGVYSSSYSNAFNSVDEFKRWLGNHRSAQFIAHRGAFDFNFLRHNDCDIREHFSYDTRSIASVLVPSPTQAEGEKSSLSLQNLGVVLLGLKPWKLDREDMSSYALDEVKTYCLKDCKVTWDLFWNMTERIPEKSWKFVEEWLMPATRLCADLEWNGIYIDKPGLESYQHEVVAQRDQVLSELNKAASAAISYYHQIQVQEVTKTYKEMYEKAKAKAKDQTKCAARYEKLKGDAILRIEPFNWNSPDQLKWLLKEYYCLDIFNKREDKETTNEAMLKTLDHPVAKKLCDYRELEKLCSTCIPALLENSKDSFVYASYNIGGTRTGRLSSSGPNLQQIPKGRIRSFVGTSVGKVLLTIDYSQIEVRIIAELSKEEELIYAFENKIDPYSVIAIKLFGLDADPRTLKQTHPKHRDVAKTAGLSILYGTGPNKLREVLAKELGHKLSYKESKRYIEDYRNGMPGVQVLRKKLEQDLANQKVCYNLLGRPFYIELHEDIYMKSLNTLVQGSASDLVIYSQTHHVIPKLKELDVDFTHRMLIHDEVVIELPAKEAELLTNEVIVPAMTTSIQKALGLSVPLAVEFNIGPVWEKPK